jgi:hypothetical protein
MQEERRIPYSEAKILAITHASGQSSAGCWSLLIPDS